MNKRILQLAVPSIISNITVPLLGLVDVAIVGHIGDAAYIGAIAVGSMLFNVIYWLFGFLRMGTSGMTSQALGRRDFSEVVRLLIRSLGIGVGIGLLFFILQRWLIGCGLWAMSPEADVVELARRYCYVCIWGAPAVLGLYGFTGWYIGMQNTRIPMVVSLSQNVVNIVASLVLVFVCRMTVEGVALGTVIAQWWGFLMACVLYRLYYRRLGKYDYRQHLFASEPLKRFFSLNRDIFLRTVCLVAVNLFFTAAGSRESTLVLAVNTLLMTLFTIFSYFMDGFAYAAEALSGKYYGAGNREAFREVVKRTMGFGVVVAILFTLIIYSGWRKLSLFVDQRQAGGGGCGFVSGMGGAYSAGRYVGICLRWHFCGHHPVEVYALFHRCSFCFILRNVFRPSSFVGQSRPVACLYSLPRFEGYRIIRHLP